MAKEAKSFSMVAEPREVTGKATRRLRRKNLIPGVVYGHRVSPQNVQISKREFEHTYLRAGNNSLVDLSVGADGKPQKVFIYEVQRNPINHEPTHIDFVVVNLREEMTATVPLVLVGESPIVRNKEGLLLHHTDHIMVRTLPTDIPPLIEVDISGLTEVDQAIHVGELELPENVTLLSNPEDLVAKIIEMPVVEEEVEEAAEAEAEGGEAEGGEAEGASEDQES